jgi:hypothetical protein
MKGTGLPGRLAPGFCSSSPFILPQGTAIGMPPRHHRRCGVDALRPRRGRAGALILGDSFLPRSGSGWRRA